MPLVTTPAADSSWLGRLRILLVLTYLLAALGTVAELLLLGHTEEFWQTIPLVLILLSVVPLLAAFWGTPRIPLRTFQVMMVLFIASGFAGLWFHYQANIEFELEVYPSLAGLELFWKAVQGKSPPSLAPGMMFELGLLGWAYTFCHPAPSLTSTHPEKETEL